MCYLLKATRHVEARGNLVGKRLIVDKPVCVCRANGLFVKTLRVELAAFDACDLRAYQRFAVFEILRAMLRPVSELAMVNCQSGKMVTLLECMP